MLLAAPKPRQWTRWEYHELASSGYFKNQRVELINGEIVEMAPQRDEHAAAVRLADAALRRVFRAGFVVQVQLPLNLGPDSEPEPDLAVVSGTARDIKRHPTSALLVVEISDTSLRFDRETKGSVYAGASIRDYWIVNLIDRQLEVYRNPGPDVRFGSAYQPPIVLAMGKTVSPLASRRAKIKVADLLP